MTEGLPVGTLYCTTEGTCGCLPLLGLYMQVFIAGTCFLLLRLKAVDSFSWGPQLGKNFGGAKERLLYCSVCTRAWGWSECHTNLPRTVCTGNSSAADCDRQHAVDAWGHPGSHRLRLVLSFRVGKALVAGWVVLAVGMARRISSTRLPASPHQHPPPRLYSLTRCSGTGWTFPIVSFCLYASA